MVGPLKVHAVKTRNSERQHELKEAKHKAYDTSNHTSRTIAVDSFVEYGHGVVSALEVFVDGWPGRKIVREALCFYANAARSLLRLEDAAKGANRGECD